MNSDPIIVLPEISKKEIFLPQINRQLTLMAVLFKNIKILRKIEYSTMENG